MVKRYMIKDLPIISRCLCQVTRPKKPPAVGRSWVHHASSINLEPDRPLFWSENSVFSYQNTGQTGSRYIYLNHGPRTESFLLLTGLPGHVWGKEW